jgi:hypothetical protein
MEISQTTDRENLNLAAIEFEIQRIQQKYPHLKKMTPVC